MGLAHNFHFVLLTWIHETLLYTYFRLIYMNLFSEQKLNATIPTGDFTKLDFEAYNGPSRGYNQLGSIGYSTEQFFLQLRKPQFRVSKNCLRLACTRLEVWDSIQFLLFCVFPFLSQLKIRIIGLLYDQLHLFCVCEVWKTLAIIKCQILSFDYYTMENFPIKVSIQTLVLPLQVQKYSFMIL